MVPALLASCQVEQWRNADLQLEVGDASVDSTTLVRICVDGVGSRDVAAGSGLVAYPGLPPNGDLTVTVDTLEPGDTGSDAVLLGRAGPVSFDGPVTLDATWIACTVDCLPCRQTDLAVDSSDTRLLAIRFNAALAG